MPRFARIHVTGGLFHVISRFHDRRFYLDIDGARQKYLELLSKATETHDSRILAYCLMSSHVHLVLQLGNDPLGTLTKKVHSPFAVWLNTRRRGQGTIMADRPKSVLVHSETYGMELIRYVHNNPVRAGVVERASDSRWSSHLAYMGLAECPPWLAIEAVLGSDEAMQEDNRHELACFVDEGRSEPRRPEFSGEVTRTLARQIRRLLGGDVELSYPILGPDDFVISALKGKARRHQEEERSIRANIGVQQLTNEVFKAMDLDPELARKRIRTSMVARGRALVAWLWVEWMGRPQVMVAEGLNVRPTAVHGMIAKLRREGLQPEEQVLLDKVFEKVTEPRGREQKKRTRLKKPEKTEPKVIVLKRRR